jgi:hypothetical protein
MGDLQEYWSGIVSFPCYWMLFITDASDKTGKSTLTCCLPSPPSVWGTVQQRVYQSRVHSVDELKQRMLDVWHGMQQSVIDSAIDEWRDRLKGCVKVRGGHFEHKM